MDVFAGGLSVAANVAEKSDLQYTTWQPHHGKSFMALIAHFLGQLSHMMHMAINTWPRHHMGHFYGECLVLHLTNRPF